MSVKYDEKLMENLSSTTAKLNKKIVKNLDEPFSLT
jgi:hypothetical protein